MARKQDNTILLVGLLAVAGVGVYLMTRRPTTPAPGPGSSPLPPIPYPGSSSSGTSNWWQGLIPTVVDALNL